METSSTHLKSSGGKGIDRKAMIFIIVTACLSSIGIGLISPVAPFLVSRYVRDASSAGLVLGATVRGGRVVSDPRVILPTESPRR